MHFLLGIVFPHLPLGHHDLVEKFLLQSFDLLPCSSDFAFCCKDFSWMRNEKFGSSTEAQNECWTADGKWGLKY